MIPTWSSSLCLGTVCSRLVCHNFVNFFTLLPTLFILKCLYNIWVQSPSVYRNMPFFLLCVRMKSRIIWEWRGFGGFNLECPGVKKSAEATGVQILKKKKGYLSIAASVVITKWQAKTKHTPLPQTEAINNGWINTSLTNHSEYKSRFFKSHAPSFCILGSCMVPSPQQWEIRSA